MTVSPRLEDAVCAYIESLEDHIEQFTQAIEINELTRFPASGWGPAKLHLTRYLAIRLSQLSAVMETHHDLLDETGRTSWLLRVTAAQDRISHCLDLIETPSTVAND